MFITELIFTRLWRLRFRINEFVKKKVMLRTYVIMSVLNLFAMTQTRLSELTYWTTTTAIVFWRVWDCVTTRQLCIIVFLGYCIIWTVCFVFLVWRILLQMFLGYRREHFFHLCTCLCTSLKIWSTQFFCIALWNTILDTRNIN